MPLLWTENVKVTALSGRYLSLQVIGQESQTMPCDTHMAQESGGSQSTFKITQHYPLAEHSSDAADSEYANENHFHGSWFNSACEVPGIVHDIFAWMC